MIIAEVVVTQLLHMFQAVFSMTNLIIFFLFNQALSMEIKQKLDVIRESRKSIDDICQGYFTYAEHSAVLYYCLTDLPKIDPMYHFSLAWFINVYILSIETA